MLAIDLVRRRDRRDGPSHPEPRRPKRDARAILLVRTERQRQIVAHHCERAHRAGVRTGMPLAQARALFPPEHVRVEDDDPARSAASVRALAIWAHRYSPRVALDPDDPHALLLDVTGCARVFRGESRLARSLLRDLERFRMSARAAIAPTFACARALARHAPESLTIVPPGGEARALRPLPVRALGIDAATERALAEVGIERIEQLLDLPRAALPARFGDGLMLRLDHALGHALEPIEPLRPTDPPHAERLFEGPTTRTDAIELAVRDTLTDLCAQMRSRECGTRSLALQLDRSDLPPVRLTLALSRPSRDAKHLWTLLRPRVERAHLGFGVEGIHATSLACTRLRHEQSGAWDMGDASAHDAPHAAGELIDTLAARLGAQRVLRMEFAASHLPERSFRAVPLVGEGASRERAPPLLAARAALLPRPSVLLASPEPAHVVALTPDGPVHRLRWRGGDVAITHCLGPERLAGEWWRAPHEVRDSFAVRDERGRWLWLVRVEPDAHATPRAARSTRHRSRDAPGHFEWGVFSGESGGSGGSGGRWFVHGVWA